MQENNLLDDNALAQVSGGALGSGTDYSQDFEIYLTSAKMIRINTLLEFDYYTVECPNGETIGPKYRNYFVKIKYRGPGTYKIFVHLCSGELIEVDYVPSMVL